MSPSFITPQKNISLIRISILEPARSMAQDLKERSTGFLFLFGGAWGALATFSSCGKEIYAERKFLSFNIIYINVSHFGHQFN